MNEQMEAGRRKKCPENNNVIMIKYTVNQIQN